MICLSPRQSETYPLVTADANGIMDEITSHTTYPTLFTINCWSELNKGRAKWRTFLRYCSMENTQLSPSLATKPGIRKISPQ